MKRPIRIIGIVFSLAAGLSLVAAGCTKVEPRKHVRGKAKPAKSHDHGEWWCPEHGVPEEECSLCNSKVADECKKNGDWCKEHDRAKSHCFICDPSLKEKFAAKHRAKYGTEPPEMPKEEKK